MGLIIIRPDPARDEYVIWDTEFETLVAWGDRCEIALEAVDLEPGRGDVRARLDSVDLCGSSAIAPYRFGWYDDGEFIFEQRGRLRRGDLVEACQLLCEDRDDEVSRLLEPLDDHTG